MIDFLRHVAAFVGMNSMPFLIRCQPISEEGKSRGKTTALLRMRLRESPNAPQPLGFLWEGNSRRTAMASDLRGGPDGYGSRLYNIHPYAT